MESRGGSGAKNCSEKRHGDGCPEKGRRVATLARRALRDVHFDYDMGGGRMWHDGMSGWGWGMGFGWMGILFWIVLILALAALIKYLFGKSGD